VNEQTLISKVWNYAHVLRDEGIAYGDYVSQISYLLLLKMDQERQAYLGLASEIPQECRWDTLKDLTGEALEKHYKKILEALSRREDFIGTVFLKAESKINDPAKLRRLVTLIDGETWMGINVDVKGTLYEACWSEMPAK
jgi:type I restriction enzyme M protein